MTGAPADRLGLTTRGRLADGLAADIVVFDPATVRALATYEDPRQFPVGIDARRSSTASWSWTAACTPARSRAGPSATAGTDAVATPARPGTAPKTSPARSAARSCPTRTARATSTSRARPGAGRLFGEAPGRRDAAVPGLAREQPRRRHVHGPASRRRHGPARPPVGLRPPGEPVRRPRAWRRACPLPGRAPPGPREPDGLPDPRADPRSGRAHGRSTSSGRPTRRITTRRVRAWAASVWDAWRDHHAADPGRARPGQGHQRLTAR